MTKFYFCLMILFCNASLVAAQEPPAYQPEPPYYRSGVTRTPPSTPQPVPPAYGSEKEGQGIYSSKTSPDKLGKQKEIMQPHYPKLVENAKKNIMDNASSGSDSTQEIRIWTSIEIILSLAILLFAFIIALFIFYLQIVLIRNNRQTWEPNSLLRIIGLVLIISSGLFLITAGYSSNQISPVMGLLGTIAGYLLGSGEFKKNKSVSNPQSSNSG